MTTLIRVSHEHKRACELAARLLRELDGIGDGVSTRGFGAMTIADDLDEIANRIGQSFAAEQDQARPQYLRRKFRAGERA